MTNTAAEPASESSSHPRLLLPTLKGYRPRFLTGDVVAALTRHGDNSPTNARLAAVVVPKTSSARPVPLSAYHPPTNGHTARTFKLPSART